MHFILCEIDVFISIIIVNNGNLITFLTLKKLNNQVLLETFNILYLAWGVGSTSEYHETARLHILIILIGSNKLMFNILFI